MAKALLGSDSRIETDSSPDVDTFPERFLNKDIPCLLSEDSNSFRNFIDFMPVDLKEENYDVLIICSPNDILEAKRFAKHLSKDVKFEFYHKIMHPIVKLTDDFRGNESESLDFLVGRSTFIFFFCTKCFCEETWSLLVSNACLMMTLHDRSRKWSVVPVLSKPRIERDFTLPLLLEGIKAINYFNNDTFYLETLGGMFATRAAMRIKRNVELDEDRKRYFSENKPMLMSMLSYSIHPTMKNQHTSELPQAYVPDCRNQLATQQIAQLNEGNLNRLSNIQVTDNIEVDSPVTRHLPREHASARNIGESCYSNEMSLSDSYSQDYPTYNENYSYPSSTAWNSKDLDSCLGQPASIYMNSDLNSLSTSSMGSSIVNNSSPPPQMQFIDNTNTSGSHNPSQNRTANSCTDQPASMYWNNSLNSLSGFSRDSSSRNNSSSSPEHEMSKSITHVHNYIHVDKAENVIIGDQGIINVNNEKYDGEHGSEEESSSSDEVDSEKIHKPPSAEEVQVDRSGALAHDRNNTALPGSGNVMDALPDLMYPHSVRDESDCPTVIFSRGPDQTFVKYTARRM